MHFLLQRNKHRPIVIRLINEEGEALANQIAFLASDAFLEGTESGIANWRHAEQRALQRKCLAYAEAQAKTDNVKLGPIAVIVLGNLIWYLIKEAIDHYRQNS